MVQLTTTIFQFAQQGEKTGWTYIKIPAAIAQQLKPGNKKTFRVKGMLDDYPIKCIALLPAGNGDFIMVLNTIMRKAIHKRKGAILNVKLEVDNKPLQISKELMECLAYEPKALNFFNDFTPSHQRYFSNWVESAKTEATKTNRIAQTITALLKGFDFGQMIRSLKQKRDELS